MHTKEQLLAEIDGLIALIRTRSNSWFALTLLPPTLAENVSELSAKCIDLKHQVLAAEGSPGSLLGASKQFLDLEIWVKRRVAKNNLMPTVIALYVGFALLFFLIQWVDFGSIVTITLGVAAPEKLITLGIAGAFVYLATSLLSRVQGQEGDTQLKHIIEFTIRLSLAIIVPIILVVLFFKPDGTVGEVTITPELTSFACGYSAKLVLDIFNKVVEKASLMVKAI